MIPVTLKMSARMIKVGPIGKHGVENIVREKPGPKGIAKTAKTEVDAILLFFDDENVQHHGLFIYSLFRVSHTNIHNN